MNARRGFTLIEIMIAIAIIAMVMAVAIPNFRGRSPRYERESFIAQVNGIMQVAWQHTLATNALHRVTFDLKKRRVSIDSAPPGAEQKKGDPEFTVLKSWHAPTSFSWEKQFKVKQFLIQGFDEMTRSAHRQTQEVYFFIMPDGITQQITINLLDTKDTIGNKPRKFGLVLNPFSAQFDTYDTFQK